MPARDVRLHSDTYTAAGLRYRACLCIGIVVLLTAVGRCQDLLDSFDQAFGPAQNKAAPNEPAEVQGEEFSAELGNSVDENAQANLVESDDGNAFQIVIATPIDIRESNRVRATLEQLQGTFPNATVIIKFQSSDESEPSIGQGSQFEACFGIARALTVPVGGKLRSIAYVDRSLRGHAVLVAMACEQIAVEPNVEFGSAGIDEANYDETIVVPYQQIAKQRGRFTPAFIDSLLTAEAQLFEVTLNDGTTQYVGQTGLEELVEQNRVLRQTRLTIPGQQGYFKGQVLREKNWIDFAPDDQSALLDELGIVQLQVAVQTKFVDDPKAVLFEINGDINSLVVNRCVRVLREARNKEEMNLCILSIRSPGGSLEQGNRLASFLLDLKAEGVETVAVIDGRCNGIAALVAMACSKVVALEDSNFGGEGSIEYSTEDIFELEGLWENLAEVSGKPASQFYGVITDKIPLLEYKSANGQIVLGTPQFMDKPGMAEQWTRVEGGNETFRIDLDEARRRGWVQAIVKEKAQVAELVGVATLPEPREMSKFDQFITRIATNEALKYALLLVGLATFTTELTAPGSIFFGFISLICFTGYFWLQFLSGTVEALEIMLFAGGILAICLEVFVLPGIGVFGIGGAIMCLLGLVLSAQRFVIPVTSVQWNELAWNLLGVSLAGLLAMVLLVAMSSQLSRSPVFKRLELQPPPAEPKASSARVLVDLKGQRGYTVTRCAPYGRAKFGGRSYEVRVEDGFIDENTEVIVIGMDADVALIQVV